MISIHVAFKIKIFQNIIASDFHIFKQITLTILMLYTFKSRNLKYFIKNMHFHADLQKLGIYA